MKYAEIAVDFHDNSQRAYTYKIPNDLLIEIGDLVWVPLVENFVWCCIKFNN